MKVEDRVYIVPLKEHGHVTADNHDGTVNVQLDSGQTAIIPLGDCEPASEQVEPESVRDIQNRVESALRKAGKPIRLEQVARDANISEYQAGVTLTNLRRAGIVRIDKLLRHSLK